MSAPDESVSEKIPEERKVNYEEKKTRQEDYIQI